MPFRTIALLGAALVLSGCVSSKTFVDPTYKRAGYGDLAKRSEPLRLRLAVEFQRNGQHLPGVDATLRQEVDRVLRVSGLIVPAADSSAGEIKVTVNNIADLAAARAKGIGTGLSFGLAGNVVTDAYEMQVAITRGGNTVRKSGKHALHTAVGNAAIPANAEIMTPTEAFGRVVEQMLLNALQELQQSGELSGAQPSIWETVRRLLAA